MNITITVIEKYLRLHDLFTATENILSHIIGVTWLLGAKVFYFSLISLFYSTKKSYANIIGQILKYS